MSQINPGDQIDWRHGGYLTTGRVVDVDDHSVIASGSFGSSLIVRHESIVKVHPIPTTAEELMDRLTALLVSVTEEAVGQVGLSVHSRDLREDCAIAPKRMLGEKK